MSTTSTTTKPAITIDEPVTLPLAMPPIREFTKQRLVGGEDGTADLHGWCAWFCAQVQDGNDHTGRTVAEHGEWCTAGVGSAFVEFLHSDGSPGDLGVELAEPYTHGTYPLDWVRVQNGRNAFVRLVVGASSDDEADRTELHMSIAHARVLAAHLLYAADNLARIATPMPGWEH